jgi:flagellar hook-basal body complex protein FliE
MTIAAISPVVAPAPQAGQAVKGGGFRSLLDSTIANVEAMRHAADGQVGQFLAGEGGELHNVALATQRAELAFEMFVQVRNKVVQAYQEVMRMQI